MKKIIPLLLIVALNACKKEEFNPDLTKEFSIQSIEAGANYRIKVGLPENYSSLQKYAAIYVLDGEENFNLVAENCKGQNVLVVSIGYGNDRATDYTPTKASEGGGGAAKFMEFLQKELIPKMEDDYYADSSRMSRTVLGHSFGGLFAAYAFTNYNRVFGNYIMLSPSIWYDNEVLLRMEQEKRAVNNGNQQLVFMGLGEMENMGRMQAPFEALYQHLKNNYSNMKLEKHLQPHLDHVGSKNPNIKAGLNYYFQNR